MRTFYVFKLNKNYKNILKKEPYNIFILLNSIYSYKNKDILVAFDTFKEICIPINKEFFNKYFYEKLKQYEEYTKFKDVHMYHNYFTGEESKMTIGISHIKIKSNDENNIFLNNMLEDLFICDFKNNFYKVSSNYNKSIKIK